MKKLLVIALIVFATQLQAQVRIGEREAFSTAARFLQQNAKQQSPVLSLNEVVLSKQSGLPNLYVFTLEPRGFVIISATGEVLAYSLNSVFPTTDERPDHIAYWIDLYNDNTDYTIEHHLPNIQHEANRQEIEPLLTSAWGQGCFHNELCPATESGPCHHASAGCVAIAMAQIMYYHKQPLTGRGEISYYCDYGVLSANFGETTYPWEDMSDTLHESNLAVALLVSHCGISVKMDYSPHSSGSSIDNALTALQSHFFYPSSRLLWRYTSNDEEWLSIIKSNLDRHLPVYYRGKSSVGGHAFVCDGYDSNGLFHFNFGWDGVADGYYTLEDPSGFADSQAIIYDISPISNTPINSDSHGIIYISPDGTGDGSSWDHATSELQSAIFKSRTGSFSIWVKEGTYTGTGLGDYCFYVFGNSHIYGGFQGNEPYDYDLSLRDFEAHPSILDGNHTQGVFNIQYSSHPTLIDGFTIQNGSAITGGGITVRSSTHLKNCKICNNQAQSNGGGIALLSSGNTMEIVIEDCEFFGNVANKGGAIYDAYNATYQHCKIHDNTASNNGGGIHRVSNGQSNFICCQICNNTAVAGGGIFFDTKASFWSCLISNNTAERGGGCYIYGETNLYNCTIVKNEGLVEYGGVYNSNSNSPSEIKNCIIWGNISQDGNRQIGPLNAHTYCAVEGSPLSSTLNFNADPENDGESPGFYVRFYDADVVAGSAGHGGDWRLQRNSLCIDRADSIAFQPATDLFGNPRLRHNKVDLGAYESNTIATVINRLFCDGDYFYNGTLLPSPGAYSFFYPNLAYDSLVIIHLDREIINSEEEICDGETIDFHGQSLHEAGHYSFLTECMAYELDLTVTPLPIEKMQAEICEGETYDFFGETLHEAGHYYFTLDCKAYELALIVTPLPIVTMEAEICAGETYDFFGETLYETGHYSTTYNCKRYELDLIVKQLPLPIVTKEAEICEGETYDFFDETLHESGHYSATYNCKIYELDLTVKPLIELHCSNDTLIEYGNVVQLTASGADSYLWSTGETTQSIYVAPNEDKTYSVTGFSKDKCDKTTKVTVRVSHEEAQTQVTLFPNPASDKVEIYMPFIDEVNLFNLLGESVFRVKANREAVELDLSSFPNGIYIVQVRQLKNLFYKKLVVQH